MEERFEEPPSCISLGNEGRMVIGCVDGSLQMVSYNTEEMQYHWKFAMKQGVRGIVFNHDESEIYTISSNRAVCSYDVETGKRTRCIVEGHKNKPNAICLLQPTARKHQQFASGDEEGEIRTWDFRAQNPKICTWKEQDGDVNALAIDSRHNLISASSDGTVAAYEVRKCKLRMKSEMMHSELISLCVTDKYVYAGGRDGYLEVFIHGDYGNILERIDSGFDMGVSSVVELRKGLLMTASETSGKLRLLNVIPTKQLGIVATHGDDEGVDQLAVSPDGLIFASVAGFANTIKIWPLQDLLMDIPVLRSVDAKKKRAIVKEGFFDDLVKKKKKQITDIHKDYEDESNNSDDEEESTDEDS